MNFLIWIFMSNFNVLVHSLLLVTSPSLLAYPQCEQSILQQVYNQEKPFEDFNLTYDDILKLLQDIEEEKIEGVSEEKIERITHFIAFLAQKGMLPGEYAANIELENDIAALFEGKDGFFDGKYNFFDYAYASNSFNKYTLRPALLNSEEDRMLCFVDLNLHRVMGDSYFRRNKNKHNRHDNNNYEQRDHHEHKKNVFAQVKDFIVKHKKAIIIGAVIVIAAALIIGAVAASGAAGAASSGGAASTGGAAAAAGAAAASPDSDYKSDKKDPPESSSLASVPASISPAMASGLKSAIDNQIFSFKESIQRGLFFEPTNPSTGQQGLSWEENGRALGSLFAHEGYNIIQNQMPYYPGFSQEMQDIHSQYGFSIAGGNQVSANGHSEIDRQFSTDYSYLYSNSGHEIDFNTLSHQVRGESALAHGYYEQAIQDFGKAIEFNPTNPIPYLERGIANFGLGQYDRSLEDYQQFTSQAQKAYPLSVPDFSLGFAKGLPKGLYESGRGILVFLSDAITHPVHTGSQMWDALKLLSDLACTEQWGTLSEVLASEVHQLVKEWDIISSDKRGELAGYAFGKYGADIIIPGTLAKAVSRGVKGAQELNTVYRGLKTAEQTFLLESAASLESSAKIAEVVQLEKRISEWLGEGAQFIRNKAEDPVFLSKDGLRKVRFDFNRPHPHESPHLHFEHLVDGEWKEINRVYPIDVPHK